MYAANIGIDADTWKGWMKKYSPNWDIIPPDYKSKNQSRGRKVSFFVCKARGVPPKHKYCYIIGKTKKETKELQQYYLKNITQQKYNLRISQRHEENNP
jgi:hypothetical protein